MKGAEINHNDLAIAEAAHSGLVHILRPYAASYYRTHQFSVSTEKSGATASRRTTRSFTMAF
jgi:hypothetical protein